MIKKLSVSQILVLGFLTVILTGAFLLMLPTSSVSNEWSDPINCLFTSTSAVCVTGLITYDTGTYWTLFGKIVIITLIQIGGLGFLSIATILAILRGDRIPLSQRIVMQESLNSNSLSGVVKQNRKVIHMTFFIEFLGALSMSFFFIPRFGIVKGIWYSIFHSISAFCNAGFDLFGDFKSITDYPNSYILNITIMLLIIIGGIGFVVITDIYNKKLNFKRYGLQTKIVLIVTSTIIVIPLFIFFFLERNNTLANMPFDTQMLASAFQVVSPRTAGFNSVDLAKLKDSSKFLQIMLMFIGGSPGSTAGGLKTVTLAVLILSIIAQVKNEERAKLFGRSISNDIIKNAVVILGWGIMLVAVGSFLVSALEPNISFIDIMYEVASAYATVGLSVGITRDICYISKIILILIMFSGRVGTLTIITAFMAKSGNSKINYPKENVMVG